MNQYLEPTPTIDSDHPAIISYANENSRAGDSQIDNAISLYYAVRDGVRYDPYQLDLSVDGMKASTTLETSHGWCVTKSVLLAACCRSIGIPSRLGFADVRNHLSTERLRQAMDTDIFHWHGYTSLYLEDQWVKATPAFNRELCEKFGIGTLEFDGRADSLYHPFDLTGQRHMEYLRDLGEFADLPLDQLTRDLREKYPKLMDEVDGEFGQDVEREVSG
jgi:transglutaminase-like putative cysteine protease